MAGLTPDSGALIAAQPRIRTLVTVRFSSVPPRAAHAREQTADQLSRT